MLTFEQRMGRMAKLAQQIQAKEPAFTEPHKQVATAKAEIEKVILKLVMEKVTVKIIFFSLLYFWLKLEAIVHNVSDQQFDKWPRPIGEIATKIIETIKLVVNNLPDPNIADELKELGTHITAMKTQLPNEEDTYISPAEQAKHVTNANTEIFMVISKLLNESFHLQIISNVIFGYVMRSSTINANVSEEYYQKMEFYFSEIIDAVRKQIPAFFR